MYLRSFKIPKDSFFLFGPRGTGKTTWLKNVFCPDIYIDLLRSENYLELSTTPQQLRAKITALESQKPIKVVIDEIQRVPILLNEVHALIEEFPQKFIFALTGSSARKLRKKEANLLAGRALTRLFFPLTAHELQDDFNLEEVLQFGLLPKIFALSDPADKIDFLYSYAQTYLKEEIQQESIVRKLPNYMRFLKHLAINNGQILNLSNISREAGIPRAPLENYMSILTDTLMGHLLEPIHLQAKVKEVSTPKFFFFDPGISEALAGNLGTPISSRNGALFETVILHELQAYNQYQRKYLDINYWGTPSKNEVDFICSKGSERIGIEAKYSSKWRPEFTKGLEILLKTQKIKRAYVIYNGTTIEKHGNILALPFLEFTKKLHNGELI